MGIKISVVVAVFNDEQHIEKCVLSVVNQRYKNYELIVIDDGSTDGTSRILEKYDLEYENVKVCRVPHCGPGTARNSALDLISGDYVLFLDSDDELFSDCLVSLCKKIENDNVGILFFSSNIVFSDGIPPNINVANYYKRPLELHNKSVSAEFFYNASIEHLKRHKYGYPVVVWGYAFKRSLCSSIRFLQESYEDEYFTTKLLLSFPNENVKFINKIIHRHHIRQGSITTQKLTSDVVIAYAQALNSLFPIINHINNKETLNNFYYNLRSLLHACLYKNNQLGDEKLPSLKILELLIKPLCGENKKDITKQQLLVLKPILIELSKLENIEQNPYVCSAVNLIDNAINLLRS